MPVLRYILPSPTSFLPDVAYWHFCRSGTVWALLIADCLIRSPVVSSAPTMAPAVVGHAAAGQGLFRDSGAVRTPFAWAPDLPRTRLEGGPATCIPARSLTTTARLRLVTAAAIHAGLPSPTTAYIPERHRRAATTRCLHMGRQHLMLPLPPYACTHLPLQLLPPLPAAPHPHHTSRAFRTCYARALRLYNPFTSSGGISLLKCFSDVLPSRSCLNVTPPARVSGTAFAVTHGEYEHTHVLAVVHRRDLPVSLPS